MSACCADLSMAVHPDSPAAAVRLRFPGPPPPPPTSFLSSPSFAQLAPIRPGAPTTTLSLKSFRGSLLSESRPSPCLQVYLEDAGFDWKILGPDVQDFDYVAWQARSLLWPTALRV